MPLPSEFREALRSLTNMAIEKVQYHISQGARVPWRTFQVPVRRDSGTWNSEERQDLLWSVLLFDSRDKLIGSPAFHKCKQFMMEIPEIARHVNQLIVFGNISRRFDVNELLFGFLAHQLEGKTVPEFSESRFAAAYDDMQTFFLTDEIEYEAWVPLENLQCPATPVSIMPAITVLRTPVEVFETIFRIEEMGYRFEQVVNWESVLHLEWTSPKIIGGSPELVVFEKIFKNMDEIVTALRLIKGERVRAGPKAIQPKKWTPLRGSTQYRSSLSSGPSPRPPLYVLATSDGEATRKVLEQLTSLNVDEFGALTLALRRFNLSYDRRHPEDRLIDQMIAFEALYLADIKGDGRAEKQFRLALRVAYFLESGTLRRGVYTDMKRAYTARSSIVHGEKPKLPTPGGAAMSLEDFTITIDNYLRRSLCKFLELTQQPETPPHMVHWDNLLFPAIADDPHTPEPD